MWGVPEGCGVSEGFVSKTGHRVDRVDADGEVDQRLRHTLRRDAQEGIRMRRRSKIVNGLANFLAGGKGKTETSLKSMPGAEAFGRIFRGYIHLEGARRVRLLKRQTVPGRGHTKERDYEVAVTSDGVVDIWKEDSALVVQVAHPRANDKLEVCVELYNALQPSVAMKARSVATLASLRVRACAWMKDNGMETVDQVEVLPGTLAVLMMPNALERLAQTFMGYDQFASARDALNRLETDGEVLPEVPSVLPVQLLTFGLQGWGRKSKTIPRT